MKLDMEVGLRSCHIVLDGDPDPPKRRKASNFRLMYLVAIRLDGLRCHFVHR